MNVDSGDRFSEITQYLCDPNRNMVYSSLRVGLFIWPYAALDKMCSANDHMRMHLMKCCAFDEMLRALSVNEMCCTSEQGQMCCTFAQMHRHGIYRNTGDLQIGNFCLNRIANRIGG